MSEGESPGDDDARSGNAVVWHRRRTDLGGVVWSLTVDQFQYRVGIDWIPGGVLEVFLDVENAMTRTMRTLVYEECYGPDQREVASTKADDFRARYLSYHTEAVL